MENSQTNTQQKEQTMETNQQFEGFRRLCLRLVKIYGEEGAEAILWMLAEEMGGERVNVPSMEVLQREARNVSIRKAYDIGYKTGEGNRAQLAERFGLDVRQIDRILQGKPMFREESGNNGS